MKYCKKPIVIDAEQWFAHKGTETPGAASDSAHTYNQRLGVCTLTHNGMQAGTVYVAGPHIHTLEGPLHVTDGDWVITGVDGEKYPCKPDIFRATYEAASQQSR